MAQDIDVLLDELAGKLRLVLEEERESLSISSIDRLEEALSGVEEIRLAANTASRTEAALKAVELVVNLLHALGLPPFTS